jgi:GntR family transcriptional regulator, transcriptional repressor for pyruvate dehydrogenase complex
MRAGGGPRSQDQGGRGRHAAEGVQILPIRKTRAYEEIVRQLQSLIADGQFRPGDRLMTERELAEQFRVSRVTVRQALSVLQAMGLVESRVGDGTFARRSQAPTVTVLAPVLSPPRSSLLEQLELGRLIEPEVARLAASRATPIHLEEMARYIGQQKHKMEQGQPFIDEDSAFHMAVARSSGNDLLVRMMESIHELLRDSRQQSLQTRAGMARSLAGHERIMDAIRRHDPGAAHRAMRRHVLEVESTIIELRQNSHEK